MKSKRKFLLVRPHTRDQSKRCRFNNDLNWAFDVYVSKIRLFCSLHNSHIKHNGTEFQLSDKCFPSLKQFLHPNKRSTNLLGNTYWIPKPPNTTFHKAYAASKWIKYSTVSPLHWHMQHQPTKEKPCLTRLSQVRIFHQASVQMKNEPSLWP